jgi:hypothetical protein
MREVSLTVIFAVAMSTVSPASAWGPVCSFGVPSYGEQVRAKYKWTDGSCKYIFKSNKKGVLEKYKCNA